MVRSAALAVLAASSFCSFDTPVLAQNTEVTFGNGYLSTCEDAHTTRSYYSAGKCFGYLQAILDYDDAIGQTSYCIPNGATNGQMLAVLIAYTKDNPAERHKPTMALLWTAFSEAFPCPKAPSN